jgi:hypothetical protein
MNFPPEYQRSDDANNGIYSGHYKLKPHNVTDVLSHQLMMLGDVLIIEICNAKIEKDIQDH